MKTNFKTINRPHFMSLVFLSGIIAAGVTHAQTTLPARFSYAAWFSCGSAAAVSSVAPSAPAAQAGSYATVVNLHNPESRDVVIQSRVSVAARIPTIGPIHPIPPTHRSTGSIASDQTTSISCDDIVNLLKLNSTPPDSAFIQGYVLVDAYFATPLSTDPGPAELDVTTTTTAAAAGSQAPAISVVPVAGRKLAAGVWPN